MVMKLLSNAKLDHGQFQAVSLAESILNSTDFKGWFLKTKFTELADFENSTNAQLYQKFFMNSEHRFSWVIVTRTWYKRFSPAIGMTDIDKGIITTYKQIYDKMSVAERAGHFAHEMMHTIGFTHSFKPSQSRDKSLPYMIGKYVQAAGELFCL
jgi:hypothetical protein